MSDPSFEEECVATGRLRPLQLLTDRDRLAARFRALAQKRLAAARELLGGEAEQFAVGQACFAMEMKANELLARFGWESKNHVCTQRALGRLALRRELASALSTAYADRQAYDYTNDPDVMAFASSEEEFVRRAADFLAEIDRDLKERGPP